MRFLFATWAYRQGEVSDQVSALKAAIRDLLDRGRRRRKLPPLRRAKVRPSRNKETA